jgi:hypothetical protein
VDQTVIDQKQEVSVMEKEPERVLSRVTARDLVLEQRVYIAGNQ